MDILLAIIAVLIPSIAAYIAMQISKGLLPFIDRQSGLVKQFIVILYGAGAAYVSSKIGVPFPADLAGLADPNIVAGILSGFFAWLIHGRVKAPLKA